MRVVVAVGAAGFFGSISRYGIEGWVFRRTGGTWPWGTFVVNVTGSLILGILFALLIEGRIVIAPWLRSALTIGLIGAYTTFSTLTLETFRLLEDGAFAGAMANAFGSLAAGMVAVYLGVVIGRLL
jgi:CrcB protein